MKVDAENTIQAILDVVWVTEAERNELEQWVSIFHSHSDLVTNFLIRTPTSYPLPWSLTFYQSCQDVCLFSFFSSISFAELAFRFGPLFKISMHSLKGFPSTIVTLMSSWARWKQLCLECFPRLKLCSCLSVTWLITGERHQPQHWPTLSRHPESDTDRPDHHQLGIFPRRRQRTREVPHQSPVSLLLLFVEGFLSLNLFIVQRSEVGSSDSQLPHRLRQPSAARARACQA